ncbi:MULTISPECIES: heparin lyase I family protein [unclassified Methylibium]|uniref:heparin lyase I family protein n=1 Tax=unclassified Methylibium TaxID=2633235 RepID=UPI0003F44EEB|nr:MULTISPECIES: heparin lyase I family protein [unclassified Methylibium]EWS54559.1 hypothetical protein X551_02639 [Methylibium sp. T29]EWS58825.1 hypothetical protein Y694_03312 [Methylibium sp. T29-B]
MTPSTSILLSALACLALAGAATAVGLAETARPAAVSMERTVPIADSDIFAEIDANKPFRQIRGGQVGLECAGAKDISVASFDAAGGFDGTAQPAGRRFGKTADPLDSSKQVLMFAPSVSDSLGGAGSKRCELSWWITQPGVIKPYIDIWHAFGLLMPDGGYDFQAVISQYHQLTSQTVNPWAAIQAEKNGLVLFVRHNTMVPPTRATNQTRIFESPGIPTKAWTVIVTKVRIDPNEGGRGYFQAWRDGVQFADYAGPTGYATIEQHPTWQKFGFYPWDHANWSKPATARVLFKAPVFVRDPTGSKYTEASLRAYVLAR